MTLVAEGYVRPDSLNGALVALRMAEPGARVGVVAGGTDLMIHVRAGRRFDLLVNLARMTELRRIEVVPGAVLVGSAVTVAELLRSAVVRDQAPLLWQAADHFASPLVRSRATLGGNLANGSPAADLSLALLALDAEVLLASAGSSANAPSIRTLSVGQFLMGPGKTALAPGELIVSVRVPASPASRRFVHFEKSGPRPALEISVAAVAVALTLDPEGRVSSPRIACGAVAPVPLRATTAEEAIAGQLLTEENIEKAARAAAHFVRPIDDVRATGLYRRRLVAAFVRRALLSTLASSRSAHVA